MKNISIHVGLPADLDAVETVEKRCFRSVRRSTRRALRRTLHVATQQVWIAWAHPAGAARQVAGVMVLHQRPHSFRIYSLGVLPAYRGVGLGRRLVAKAVAEAQRRGVRYVSLEADCRDRRLVRWYAGLGFEVVRVCPDYYSEGRAAAFMRRFLSRRHPATGGESA